MRDMADFSQPLQAPAMPDELSRLRAENERLREALGPIAAFARYYDPIENDDHEMPWGKRPTLGDLRRARKALEGEGFEAGVIRAERIESGGGGMNETIPAAAIRTLKEKQLEPQRLYGNKIARRNRERSEIDRLTALVEHLKADRIRISEEAEAEIARMKVEAGSARMCLNCGKIVPASHPRHKPLPECVGPEGLSACTFDHTPQEAWQIWRDRYYALRDKVVTEREEGRLEGLEEAAKEIDAEGSRHADASNRLYAENAKDAARLSSYASLMIYYLATAIRALKENQQ